MSQLGEEPGIYVVAVIDVLGYKNLMTNPELKSQVDWVIHLCNRSVQFPGGMPSADSGMVISAIFETDSIRITYNYNTGPMFADHFWGCLHYVCHYMMTGGYIVRGGVGFGSSSAEGYHAARAIEQSTNYPRIQFQNAQDMLALLTPMERRMAPGEDPFRGLVRRVDQFDFLRFTLGILSNPENEGDVIRERLGMTKGVLLRGLSLASPNLAEGKKVYEKYRWYAEYYNEVATEYGAELIAIK